MLPGYVTPPDNQRRHEGILSPRLSRGDVRRLNLDTCEKPGQRWAVFCASPSLSQDPSGNDRHSASL